MADISSTGSIPTSSLSNAQQYGAFALKLAAKQDEAAIALTKQAAESAGSETPPPQSSGGHLVDVVV